MKMISNLLFVSTGAFVIWMSKGFKGSFNDHMVSFDKRHSTQGYTRPFLGILIWGVVLVVLYNVLKSEPDGLMYEFKN